METVLPMAMLAVLTTTVFAAAIDAAHAISRSPATAMPADARTGLSIFLKWLMVHGAAVDFTFSTGVSSTGALQHAHAASRRGSATNKRI